MTVSRLISLATPILVFLATQVVNAQEAPAPNDADPRVALVQQQLEQMKEQGASPVELMLIETMAYYQLGMDKEAAAKIADIKAKLPAIEKADGEASENARAARAIVRVAEAREAWKAGDMKTAEAKMGEAFFQLPEVAVSVAGEWVNTYWQDKRMANLTVPMDKPLEIAAGGETTLAKLAEGNKAVYIDFWASWCGPCMAAMPELKELTAEYTPRGIAFAGVNLEGKPEAEKVAKDIDIAATKLNWLVETEAFPLSDLLGISSIPHVALVAPDGKILWMGHPSEPALAEKLEELAGS